MESDFICSIRQESVVMLLISDNMKGPETFFCRTWLISLYPYQGKSMLDFLFWPGLIKAVQDRHWLLPYQICEIVQINIMNNRIKKHLTHFGYPSNMPMAKASCDVPIQHEKLPFGDEWPNLFKDGPFIIWGGGGLGQRIWFQGGGPLSI